MDTQTRVGVHMKATYIIRSWFSGIGTLQNLCAHIQKDIQIQVQQCDTC